MESCLLDCFVEQYLHRLLVLENAMMGKTLPWTTQLPLNEDSRRMASGPQAKLASGEVQIVVIAMISTNLHSCRFLNFFVHDGHFISIATAKERVFQCYLAQ